MLFEIVILVVAVNVLSFILMILDKNDSKKGSKYRVPEKSFNLLFGMGGYPGIYLGMTLFNHKISKWNFYIRAKFLYAIFTIVIWVTEYYLFTRLIKIVLAFFVIGLYLFCFCVTFLVKMLSRFFCED